MDKKNALSRNIQVWPLNQVVPYNQWNITFHNQHFEASVQGNITNEMVTAHQTPVIWRITVAQRYKRAAPAL